MKRIINHYISHCKLIGRGNSKKAFTLIELLISLIIISLITSALVPVLSKKLKYREISYSNAKQMKTDCSAYDTAQGSCLLCDENKCNLCTSSINTPDGYYVNPNISCNKQLCTNFDIQCKRCTKDGCQECIEGYKLEEGICEKFITLQAPSSQEDCHDAYYYQGMCITKRNAGDTGGPNINITNVKVVSTKTSCSGKYCCWRGSKTMPHYKDRTGSTYSAKNRTACQIEAAKLICQNYSTSWSPSWELPNSVDKDVISAASNAVKGINGMQLCIATNDSDEVNYCSSVDGEKADYQYCKGGNKDAGTENYHKCRTGHLMDISINDSSTGSVRCITKKVYK